MAKKDIFKIDNYTISFGIIFLIIGLAVTLLNPRTFNDVMISEGGIGYSFERLEGRTIEEIQRKLGPEKEITIIKTPLVPPIIALSGLCLLLIGIIFRKKENKIISIWDALEKTAEGKVRDMEVALGLSREFILGSLQLINAQQGTYYVYRSEGDKIVDGKLLEEHTVSLNCSGCGHNINKKITLAKLNGLSCSYCGAPIQTEELSEIRSSIVEENRASQEADTGGNFSVGIFILLLVVFWPAAIIYLAIKKGSAAKKSVESLKQFSMENLQNPEIIDSESESSS